MSAAAITMVRNDAFFLPKWIAHYGRAFGAANLFVLLDGHDQQPPAANPGVNVIRLPHVPSERSVGDRRRARLISSFADGLFRLFDTVVATDVDEFLVLDPALGTDLSAYLDSHRSGASASALGLDVGQHLRDEGELDPSRPFLEQRAFAHVSARYTKPVVAFKPVTWGSGLHRIKGRNFRIDRGLYLFHFGMVDFARATGKTLDPDRITAGWGAHLERREALFKLVTESVPFDGDSYFDIARRRQTWRRPLYALNKPGMIPGDPVVRIPSRFRSLV